MPSRLSTGFSVGRFSPLRTRGILPAPPGITFQDGYRWLSLSSSALFLADAGCEEALERTGRLTRYVAFLRGINLGKRRVQMSRLRSLFEELGFSDVATFIASGNVIFSAAESRIPRLESRIAERLEEALGYDVDTFVRPLTRVVAIAGSTPFMNPRDGESIYVTFLHDALDARTASALAGIRTEHDRFAVHELEYFWACAIRSSDSRIWVSAEIRSLSLPAGTTRNMTSIRKLVAAHGPGDTPVRDSERRKKPL